MWHVWCAMQRQPTLRKKYKRKNKDIKNMFSTIDTIKNKKTKKQKEDFFFFGSYLLIIFYDWLFFVQVHRDDVDWNALVGTVCGGRH